MKVSEPRNEGWWRRGVAALTTTSVRGTWPHPVQRPARLLLEAGWGVHDYANPSQGALVWHLGSTEVGMCDQYCLGARDPALDVLAPYRRRG